MCGYESLTKLCVQRKRKNLFQKLLPVQEHPLAVDPDAEGNVRIHRGHTNVVRVRDIVPAARLQDSSALQPLFRSGHTLVKLVSQLHLKIDQLLDQVLPRQIQKILKIHQIEP